MEGLGGGYTGPGTGEPIHGRPGAAHWRLALAEAAGARARAASAAPLIKSNNPHLAGGEKQTSRPTSCCDDNVHNPNPRPVGLTILHKHAKMRLRAASFQVAA